MVSSSPRPLVGSILESPSAAKSASEAEALVVLLVEDDESDAERAHERLSGSIRPKFRLVRAPRLCDASALLSRESIDVVLLDLNLPDSRGIATFDRLIAEHPETPIVVLTGGRDDSAGTLALQRGAQDFLFKEHLDTEVLRRSLRYAVERNALRSRADASTREAKGAAARLRRLIETSAEGFVVLDRARTVCLVNPAAEAMFGRAAAELLGRPLPLAFGVGLGNSDDVDLRRPDGTAVPAEVRVAPLEWEGGDATLVSMHDLSDRRREERVALARAVQRAFLPERTALASGTLSMSARNELCEDASGDGYDFVELADGRVVVAVGDVTGHGLGPALLMAQGRAFLRAFCEAHLELGALMRRWNDAMAADMTDGRFMSVFLAIVDPQTGSMAWCNAGHVPALLRRARTGVVETLEPTGMPLGIVPGISFDAVLGATLEPGDVLLLATDGLTEATSEDGEQFGLERAISVFRGDESPGAPWASADEALDALRDALHRFTRGRPVHDDLTLVAIRRDGAPSRSRAVSVVSGVSGRSTVESPSR